MTICSWRALLVLLIILHDGIAAFKSVRVPIQTRSYSVRNEVDIQPSGDSMATFREFLFTVRRSNNVKSLFARIDDLREMGSLRNEHLLLSIRTLDRMKGVNKHIHILPLIEAYKTQLIHTRDSHISLSEEIGEGWYEHDDLLSIIRTCGKLKRIDVAESFLSEVFHVNVLHTSTTTEHAKEKERKARDRVPSEIMTALLGEMIISYTLNQQYSKALLLLDNMLRWNYSLSSSPSSSRRINAVSTTTTSTERSMAQDISSAGISLGDNLQLSKTIFIRFLKTTTDITIIRSALRKIIALGGLYDKESLHLITNCFVQDIRFIKGATSMDSLPKLHHDLGTSVAHISTNHDNNNNNNNNGGDDNVDKSGALMSSDMPPGRMWKGGRTHVPEIAFIGRSNVGKSSLVNMLTNRKGLAFTSKTPGKTSEFNYFELKGKTAFRDLPAGIELVGTKRINTDHRKSNTKPEGKKKMKRQHAPKSPKGAIGDSLGTHRTTSPEERAVKKLTNTLYFVDLPGLGYAEAKRSAREAWLQLLNLYVTQRRSLRVVLHLVDSRHGLLDVDHEILQIVNTILPSHVKYIIVMTKADKLKNASARQDMLETTRQQVEQIVREGHTPIGTDADSGDISTDSIESSNENEKYSIPVVMTSSADSHGGTRMWSQLLDAVDDANYIA